MFRMRHRFFPYLLAAIALVGCSQEQGAAPGAASTGGAAPGVATTGGVASIGGAGCAAQLCEVGGVGGTTGSVTTSGGIAGRSGTGGTASDVARKDITAAVLGNQDIVLSGDAIARLPTGATTYTGVISGEGTVRLSNAGGACEPSTLIITRQSTYTLPVARQVEVVTKAGPWPSMGYRLDITGSNPPVLIIDPCVTFQIGTNSTQDQNPNIIATSDSLNAVSVVAGEVNLDNIENNGTLALASSQFILLGEISGIGNTQQLPNVWGGNSLRGTSTMTGGIALAAGQDFGSNHVPASLNGARAVQNEGSWLVWSPANNVVTVTQDIYEAAFGNDINFHPIGNGRIVMRGVYSHTDNSPHDAPNVAAAALSDPTLNYAKVIYRGTMTANGNDASYRGVNIEAEGTVEWGDGTHARFFLPSAPSPAEVSPALGAKNAYINLHRGGTLAFNYNAPVTLNIGITGGGGGPDRSGTTGTGNVTIRGTPGNDVTFGQPQDYNGTTTIEAGATLRLGTGTPVPLNYVTLNGGVKSVQHVADYNGDSSLLTAESTRGANTDSIVNNGTLIIQNTSLTITLSHMSGTGKLVQSGPATATLLANTYRGGTLIDGGTLRCADESALGRGDVRNAATLVIDSTEVRVRGDYRQTGNGTLLIASRGTAKRLVVNGRAELSGTLALDLPLEDLRPGRRIEILRARGGVVGQFAAITGGPAELRAEVRHGVLSVVVERAKSPRSNHGRVRIACHIRPSGCGRAPLSVGPPRDIFACSRPVGRHISTKVA